MKNDIEIAQSAVMKPIVEIAKQIGLTEDELESYGKYKAKVNLSVWNRLKDKPNGNLILVTAINPTPAGEGKNDSNRGLRTSTLQNGQEGYDCCTRTITWTLLWS